MGGRLRAISATPVREICWLTLNCARLEPIFYSLDNCFTDENRAILKEYAIVQRLNSTAATESDIHWEQSQVPRLRLSANACCARFSCFLYERDCMQMLFEPLNNISNLSNEVTIGKCLPSFSQEPRIPQIGRYAVSETKSLAEATDKRSLQNLHKRPLR